MAKIVITYFFLSGRLAVWVSDVSATSGTITGLRIDTSYNVTVAIYTSKDVELGQTEPVIAQTGN